MNTSMTVNLNVKVKCKLTEVGKEVYMKHMSKFNDGAVIKSFPPNELTLPLWDFCNIFGSEMVNGNPRDSVTVGNEVEIINEVRDTIGIDGQSSI